jgi:glycerol-1-phosphate dehydrogenase [NAD(P)+]
VLLEAYPLHATSRRVEQVTAALASNACTPIAVGSGTINDLVKLAAGRLERPYLVVGTAASMDGYAAFGASITHEGLKQTFACPAPRAIVADLDVMRRAPPELVAAGYGDMLAKVVCGADWLLADAVGIEPVDAAAWSLVQDGLPEAIGDPAALARGEPAIWSAFVEGLLLGGLAMQWTRTSRPASGAEHQFSHLWDMQHAQTGAAMTAHGFQVGVASRFVAALYEEMLAVPFEALDVTAACAGWPDWPDCEAETRARVGGGALGGLAVGETRAKHVTRDALAAELGRLRTVWPELRPRLRRQLLTAAEMGQRLRLIGAPDTPEAIGRPRADLLASVIPAQRIRRRYTVLDACLRAGCLEKLAERACCRL